MDYECEVEENAEEAELIGWSGDATRCSACGETIWYVRGQQAAEVVLKMSDHDTPDEPREHLLIHAECFDPGEMELA